MKSLFKFQIYKEYILVHISGRYDKMEFLSLIKEIQSRCVKEQIYNVLVDAQAVRNADISTTDRYFLGEKIAQELRDNIKIAIVWSAEHIDKFAEIVASNRGADILVSGDYKSAENWLLKGQI